MRCVWGLSLAGNESLIWSLLPETHNSKGRVIFTQLITSTWINHQCFFLNKVTPLSCLHYNRNMEKQLVTLPFQRICQWKSCDTNEIYVFFFSVALYHVCLYVLLLLCYWTMNRCIFVLGCITIIFNSKLHYQNQTKLVLISLIYIKSFTVCGLIWQSSWKTPMN